MSPGTEAVNGIREPPKRCGTGSRVGTPRERRAGVMPWRGGPCCRRPQEKGDRADAGDPGPTGSQLGRAARRAPCSAVHRQSRRRDRGGGGHGLRPPTGLLSPTLHGVCCVLVAPGKESGAPTPQPHPSGVRMPDRPLTPGPRCVPPAAGPPALLGRRCVPSPSSPMQGVMAPL